MTLRNRLLATALACAASLLVLIPASGANRADCRPGLAILSPKAGSTIEGALVVRYRIACLVVDADRPAYLRVVLPGVELPVRAVKRLSTEAGSTTVSISKLETGQRDLRFTLLRANRKIADSVLVRDVLLAGGR
jgi:hypothetical protein